MGRGGAGCFYERDERAERALIAKVGSGDKNAFERLMGPHLKIIYNYISSKVRGDADVRDIAQETMLGVWQGLSGFDERSSFRTWCVGIARRKIADYYRSAYKYAAEPLSEHEEDTAAADEYGGVDDRLAVEQSVAALRVADKELVFLVFSAQLSYAEIAGLLDIPVGTVKSRMSAIKTKLRKQLENGGRA